jgi:hypothetical protein
VLLHAAAAAPGGGGSRINFYDMISQIIDKSKATTREVKAKRPASLRAF